MPFLNKLGDMAKNIGDKAGDMAKNIGDKAGDAIETTKLNSKINSEKNAIDNVYKKIGDYYYQQYKTGISLPPETVEFCAEIDGHNAVIDEAKAEIERIKAENATTATAPTTTSVQPPVAGEAICPTCKSAYTPGTKFCQGCGAKLDAVEKRFCPCGAEIAPGSRFCGECGAKFE